MKKPSVDERINDNETAVRCIDALVKIHEFHVEEPLFKEDCRYSIKKIRDQLIKYAPKEVSAGLFILNTAGVIGEQNAEYIVKSIMRNFPNGIKIVEEK